jgi:hypothetical protein
MLYSEGAKDGLYSHLILDLIEMSEKKMPDNWWDYYLYQKTHCQSCETPYKMENLSVCTGCYLLRCYGCSVDKTIPPLMVMRLVVVVVKSLAKSSY